MITTFPACAFCGKTAASYAQTKEANRYIPICVTCAKLARAMPHVYRDVVPIMVVWAKMAGAADAE